MDLLNIIKRDLSELFKKPLTRMTLAAVTLIPLLYSGLYLWAFWNPYARMDRLPAGIVNLDGGAGDPVTHEQRRYGQKLADALLESGSMRWRRMSLEHAKSGLRDGHIYFYLLIPKNFSKSLVSAASDNPRQAGLRFVVNESRNVLIPQIGGRVVDEVKGAYSREVTEQTASLLLDAAQGAAGGLNRAASGAVELSQGAKVLTDGSVALTAYLNQAGEGAQGLAKGLTELSGGARTLSISAKSGSTGARKLAGGLGDAYAGARRIREGLTTGSAQVAGAASQLREAAAGADRIAAGSAAAADGTAKLFGSVRQLREGMEKTREGADRLAALLAETADMMERLNQGPSAKAMPDLGRLALQTKEAAKSAAVLRDAMAETAQGTSRLAEASQGLSRGQAEVADGAKALSDRLSKAPEAMAGLSDGLGSVSEGLAGLETGLYRLQSGADDLNKGLSRIAEGSSKLESGISAAETGSVELAHGISKLAVGGGAMTDGLIRLGEGGDKLASGLSEGVRMTRGLSSKPGLSADKAHVIADPIRVVNVRVNPVDTYGAGFAPYFLSLSLWVGALLLFFAVDVKTTGADLSETGTAKALIGKFAVVAAVASLQGALSCAVVQRALHMPVIQMGAYYGFGILSSVAFAAVLFFFVAGFGMAGRFAGILILMLQLTSCGGTFPPETLPGFFRAIKPWLPMTYTVQAFRTAISTGYRGDLAEPLKLLLVYGGVSLALAPLTIKKDLEKNELRPKSDKFLSSPESESF